MENQKDSVNEKSGKISSGSNKILIGIIALLLVVIIGLVIAFVGNEKKNDDKKDDLSNSTTAVNDVTTDTQKEDDNTAEASTNTEAATDEASNASTDKSVVITMSNQWEADGNYFGQMDLKIKNTTSKDIKNWVVEIPVSSDLKMDSKWNCEFELSNGKILIKPVDYNATIAASSELKDIGFIVRTTKKADFDSFANSAVLVGDGVKDTVESSTEQKEEATTEQTTEQKEEITTEQEITTNQEVSEQDNITTSEQIDDNKNEQTVVSEKGSPYENHGKLRVDGVDLVDASGKKYQLKGVSTHGIAWFPDYVNKEAFKTIRDDWNGNLIRLAMYSGEGSGYCTGGDKDYLKNLMISGVDAATELGMYVIIDWHVLGDQNPLVYKEEAKIFFDEMSKKYRDFGNVIYEICNEPNGGTTWEDVKSYAEEVIPIIKANSKDAVIIVGTPTWSQDVDRAAENPITGYSNIMYATHFYAATHTDWLRNKVTAAREAGIPIFISEFSICDASGNGAIDYNQAEEWFKLIGECNLSYAAWSLCNKAETSALISSSCTKLSGWTESELSECGNWLRNKILGK